MGYVRHPRLPLWPHADTLALMDIEQLQDLSRQWEREVNWLSRKSLATWVRSYLDPEYRQLKTRLLKAATINKICIDRQIRFRQQQGGEL